MPLDYSKTLWVRLYKDRRPKWRTLDWRARGIMSLILEEVDMDGKLELGEDAIAGIAQAIHAPPDEIRPYVELLLGRESILIRGDAVEVPNFELAQSAKFADSIRSRAYRERKRVEAKRGQSDPDDPNETPPQRPSRAPKTARSVTARDSNTPGNQCQKPSRGVTDPSQGVMQARRGVTDPSRGVTDASRGVTKHKRGCNSTVSPSKNVTLLFDPSVTGRDGTITRCDEGDTGRDGPVTGRDEKVVETDVVESVFLSRSDDSRDGPCDAKSLTPNVAEEPKPNESILSYANSNNLSMREVIGEILSQIPNLDPALSIYGPSRGVTPASHGVTEATRSVSDASHGVMEATRSVLPASRGVMEPSRGVTESTSGSTEGLHTQNVAQSTSNVTQSFSKTVTPRDAGNTPRDGTVTPRDGTVTRRPQKKRRESSFLCSLLSSRSGSVTLEIFFTKNQLLVNEEPDPDFEPPKVEWIVGAGTRVRGASLVPLLEARLHAAGIRPDRRLINGTAVDLGRRMVDWASRGALDLTDWSQIAAMAESFADCWVETELADRSENADCSVEVAQ